MSTFEIYLDDLTEETKTKFLQFQGIESAEEGNFDYFPITIIEREDNDET